MKNDVNWETILAAMALFIAVGAILVGLALFLQWLW